MAERLVEVTTCSRVSPTRRVAATPCRRDSSSVERTGAVVCRALMPGIDRAPVRRMLRSVMIDQAAVLLGVSRRTVYYRIREGKLLTIRTRCNSQRVLLESLHALMSADRGWFTTRGAGVSDTDPSGRFPVL